MSGRKTLKTYNSLKFNFEISTRDNQGKQNVSEANEKESMPCTFAIQIGKAVVEGGDGVGGIAYKFRKTQIYFSIFCFRCAEKVVEQKSERIK